MPASSPNRPAPQYNQPMGNSGRFDAITTPTTEAGGVVQDPEGNEFCAA
jgi:hypothetical protein